MPQRHTTSAASSPMTRSCPSSECCLEGQVHGAGTAPWVCGPQRDEWWVLYPHSGLHAEYGPHLSAIRGTGGREGPAP